jgi:hypothetical protein
MQSGYNTDTEYSLKRALLGLLKFLALISAGFVVFILISMLLLSFAKTEPGEDIDAWCREYHPELSWSECLDEAGV